MPDLYEESRDESVARLQWALSIVGMVFGVFLLVAAGLKLYSISSDLIRFVTGVEETFLSIAVCAIEMFVGILLLKSGHSRLAWIICLTLFFVFLGVSLIGYLEGAARCGCLGVVQTTPLTMIVVDCIGIVASAICVYALSLKPRNPGSHSNGQLVYSGFNTSLGVLIIVWGLLGAVTFANVEYKLTRNPLVVPSRPQKVAAVQHEYPADISVLLPVRNVSDHDVTISGLKSSCKTLVDMEFPVRVAAKGVLHIPVRTTFQLDHRRGFISLTVYSDEYEQLSRPFHWTIIR